LEDLALSFVRVKCVVPESGPRDVGAGSRRARGMCKQIGRWMESAHGNVIR